MAPHVTYQCTIPRYYMNDSDALNNTQTYAQTTVQIRDKADGQKFSESDTDVTPSILYIQTPIRLRTSTSESLASLKLVYPGVFGALRLDATPNNCLCSGKAWPHFQ